MIYTVLGDGIDSTIEMMSNEGEFGKLLGKDVGTYRSRVVRSLDEFNEKLYIFDAGKDDKIVEIMKAFIATQISNEKNDMDYDELTFVTNTEGISGFLIKKDNEIVTGLNFSDGLYEAILKDFGNKIAEDDNVLIDAAWTVDFLEKNAEEET